MNTVSNTASVVRQPAEWMQPVDDRILELFREHGNLTPAAVEEFGGPSSSHASRRCKQLARYGLLEQIVTGLYTITEEGEAYLDEELDASELKATSETS
nr:PhiH1 repressor [Natronolimnohabitans innermongolicus]